MKTSSRWLLLIGCVGLLTALALPQSAHADSVTFTGPSTITLTEDGSTQTFFYTVSNPASGTTLTNLATTGTATTFGGDITDIVAPGSAFLGGTPGGVPGATCGVSLAPGASCTMGLLIVLPNGAGETDADFGTLFQQFGVVWSGNPTGLSENVTITINDPGVVATPEPSSLLLLGSGLVMLCLAWFGARRETKAS